MKYVKAVLAKYCDGLPNCTAWREYLPEVLAFLRFTQHESTGMSPFEACFGFEPVVPSMIAASRLLGFHVAYERDGGDDEFVEHMSKVRELLGARLARQDASYARKYAKRHEGEEGPAALKAGQLVLLRQRR